MKKMYENKRLEDEFHEIIDNKYDFDEIIQKQNSYEYYYYLSRLRENLFVWYPFKEDACLLELGGGYGALTNLIEILYWSNNPARLLKQYLKFC